MTDLMQRLVDSFRPLYGKPCWNARLGYGSSVTLEFGEPHLEIREPRRPNPSRSPAVQRLLARRRVFIHGEWHLWVYCCNWVVTPIGQRVGESTSARRMEEAMRELDGQALVQVDADLRRSRWYFEFDLGGRLETRPYGAASKYYEGDNEQWLLYEPSGYVLTVRADGPLATTLETHRPQR